MALLYAAAYAAVSAGISFYLRTPELNGAAGATIIGGSMVPALPTLSQFNAIVSSQNLRHTSRIKSGPLKEWKLQGVRPSAPPGNPSGNR